MTKTSALWTCIRQNPLLAAPAAVGLPIAVAFAVAGSLGSRPAHVLRVALPANGSVPRVVGGPVASPDPTDVGQGDSSGPAEQSSGRRNVSQIALARTAAAANPAIRVAGATGRGRLSGLTGIAAVRSAAGAVELSLSHGRAGGLSATSGSGVSSLPGLQSDSASGPGARAITRVQPVTGTSTPQSGSGAADVSGVTPAAGQSAVPLDHATGLPVTDVSQILAAAPTYSVTAQPSTVNDYSFYSVLGLDPSAAYDVGSVNQAIANGSISQAELTQMGYRLMRAVGGESGYDVFWVGPLQGDAGWEPVS